MPAMSSSNARTQWTRSSGSALLGTVVPAASSLLAIAAGAVHLARALIPMGPPPSASGPSGFAPGMPPGGAGAPSGLIGLVMPHLNQVFILNFVAFVALAVVLFVIARGRPLLRVIVDVLLGSLSAVTLYAWNEMGRINPGGAGTMAMVLELALMLVVIADILVLLVRSRARSAQLSVA
jgi:hypothetical protein